MYRVSLWWKKVKFPDIITWTFGNRICQHFTFYPRCSRFSFFFSSALLSYRIPRRISSRDPAINDALCEQLESSVENRESIRARVYNASRLKRRIHMADNWIFDPIKSADWCRRKRERVRSTDRIRYFPFVRESTTLRVGVSFIKLQMNAQGFASARARPRAPARSISAAENRLCAPYGLHHAALSVRNCDCKVASETRRPLSIINLVGEPIRLRWDRLNLETAFYDVS